MRIGLVCPYDLSKPGGVQAQVLGLAAALGSAGDQVTVIGPGLPDEVGGVDLGRTVSIPGNGSMVPISLDPRVGRRIKVAVRDLDVLHVHEPLMPAVSLAALRAGPPVVATFHAAPERIGRRFYRLIGSQLSRVLGGNVRRVTAVSETAASALPDDLETAIVPNGLDVSVMSADVERDTGRVVFLGRDERRKGLDVLLEAWVEITSAVPQAELVVMGADRGTPWAEWMGWVEDEKKVEVLNTAAIYVAPNIGGESFGIVLLEAMAAGAAVAASDIPAFVDVAGDAARFFKVGDSHDLARVVIDLLNDDNQRQELAQRGTKKVAAFDWSHVAPAYRALYEESAS